jgi:hypothetical protein
MAKNSASRAGGGTGSGRSIAGALEQAVSNVVNAASVAATGSEIGVLELAVEDDLKPSRARKPAPKAKKAAAKTTKVAPRTASKTVRGTARKPTRKQARKPVKKKAAARRRAR